MFFARFTSLKVFVQKYNLIKNDTSKPGEEKILSDGSEVVGTAKNSRSKKAIQGKRVSFVAHETGGHCQGRTFPICTVFTPRMVAPLWRCGGKKVNTIWSPNMFRGGLWVLANISFLTGVNILMHVSGISTIRLTISFLAILFWSDDKKVRRLYRGSGKDASTGQLFYRFILWWIVSTVQFLSNWTFGSANCRIIVLVNYQTFKQQSAIN